MLQIKAAALRDVGQWLVTIRSQAVAVGKGALRKCNNFMSGLGKVGQLVRGLLRPQLADLIIVTVLKAGLRVSVLLVSGWEAGSVDVSQATPAHQVSIHSKVLQTRSIYYHKMSNTVLSPAIPPCGYYGHIPSI